MTAFGVVLNRSASASGGMRCGLIRMCSMAAADNIGRLARALLWREHRPDLVATLPQPNSEQGPWNDLGPRGRGYFGCFGFKGLVAVGSPYLSQAQ